jgi:hypothetical protein
MKVEKEGVHYKNTIVVACNHGLEFHMLLEHHPF